MQELLYYNSRTTLLQLASLLQLANTLQLGNLLLLANTHTCTPSAPGDPAGTVEEESALWPPDIKMFIIEVYIGM